jgi:hypothetical protein
MSLGGYDFMQGKFQDVGWLMNEVDALYTRIVEKHGETKSLLPLTAQQLVKLRGWEQSMPIIAPNLEPVLNELKIFFIPKVMQPGPAIVFPQRDIYGNYPRARMKPMFDLILKDGPAKYGSLGIKHEWKGPAWFGNSLENTERLIRYRKVVLVEGPMDHVASRLVTPQYPIMSTGTKSLNDNHLDYLEMLGVEEILLMWDNETGKKAGSGGLDAMNAVLGTLRKDGRFRAFSLYCPASDPAECLKTYSSAHQLKQVFQQAFE